LIIRNKTLNSLYIFLQYLFHNNQYVFNGIVGRWKGKLNGMQLNHQSHLNPISIFPAAMFKALGLILGSEVFGSAAKWDIDTSRHHHLMNTALV